MTFFVVGGCGCDSRGGCGSNNSDDDADHSSSSCVATAPCLLPDSQYKAHFESKCTYSFVCLFVRSFHLFVCMCGSVIFAQFALPTIGFKKVLLFGRSFNSAVNHLFNFSFRYLNLIRNQQIIHRILMENFSFIFFYLNWVIDLHTYEAFYGQFTRISEEKMHFSWKMKHNQLSTFPIVTKLNNSTIVCTVWNNPKSISLCKLNGLKLCQQKFTFICSALEIDTFINKVEKEEKRNDELSKTHCLCAISF